MTYSSGSQPIVQNMGTFHGWTMSKLALSSPTKVLVGHMLTMVTIAGSLVHIPSTSTLSVRLLRSWYRARTFGGVETTLLFW